MLLQSCSKEPVSTNGTPITKYEYLTASALNQTPYFTNPAFDTISFASDKGDTLTFVKTKTDTSWYCENQSLSSNYKICYQTLHNTYSTIKGIGSFDVKHSRKENDYNNFIEISFNNTVVFINDWIIDYKDYPTYISSIFLKGKEYNNLTRVTINNGTENIAITYINKKYGLFYFEDLIQSIKYTLIN